MENATFHWLLQGSSKDLEVLLYELDDEGLLGAKMPRPDGMSDEENNLRQLADRHQRIARALVYGSKAFSTALPLALLTLASTRLLEKTTDIQANERDLKSWPDRVEYFFDSINIEESGMTVRSINRLKRFLSKTLPALQDAGAAITDDHVLAIVKDGDFNFTRGLSTVSTLTDSLGKAGLLDKEAADKLADHIVNNTPSEKIVGEFHPEETELKRLEGFFRQDAEGKMTITIPGLTGKQCELIQEVLSDVVEWRWEA